MDGGAPLGGPKQRALLAHLLREADRAVPAERLIDAVWGEEPPETAGHALQVYVSQLRKAIAPTGARIERRGAGYELVLNGARVDAHAFAELVRDGRAALHAGDAERARELLAAALALWRGPASPDLDAAREAATDDLADAELALGRHAEVLPELERRVRDDPLRERTQRQLVLALYRTGRQAEALAAHRRAREALDELGLEPGPELRALETAILRQDASLDVEAPELRARRHLPAPATELVGRAAEVAEVTALLKGAARLVTLTGPGGVGKTRVALQAAYELAADFPDGVWFVELAPLVDPRLVRPTVARALGSEDGELDEHLRDRRALLVLDNYEQVLEAATVVSGLLSAAPGVRVLVTSRQPLDLYGEHELALPPLSDAEAAELFVARARAAGRVPTDTAAVTAVCERLDRLPLAVELVAARTRTLTLAEITAALDRTLELAVGGPRDLPERQRALRAAIGWSYDLLEPAAAALFGRLAVFAGGFEEDAAAEVARADDPALAELVAASLVERAAGGRYRMLETVREYAFEVLAAAGDDEAVRERHARRFQRLAGAAGEALWAPDQRERERWLERVVVDIDNIRAAEDWLERHDRPAALAVAADLADFWLERGRFAEGARRLDAVLDEPAAPAPLRAKALHAAFRVVYNAGDRERGFELGERSLDIYRELGDSEGIGRTVHMLAYAARAAGDGVRARAYAEESLALARELGHTRGVIVSLSALARLVGDEGDHGAADALLREALELAERHGDLTQAAEVQFVRGDERRRAGETREAAGLLVDSLRRWDGLGNDGSQALVVGALGLVLVDRGLDEPGVELVAACCRQFELAGADWRQDVEFDETLAAAQERLGATAFSAAWERGRGLELGAALAAALAAGEQASRA